MIITITSDGNRIRSVLEANSSAQHGASISSGCLEKQSIFFSNIRNYLLRPYFKALNATKHRYDKSWRVAREYNIVFFQ